jgi:tetratricopeptide (TPR) repeat protein
MTATALRFAILSLLGLFTCSSHGTFAPVEVERVPIDQLINNLERQLSSATKESTLIEPGESIRLDVWTGQKASSFNRDYEIDKQGFIELPKAGRVKVAGLEPANVGVLIKQALEKATRIKHDVGVYQSPLQRKGRLLPGEASQLRYAIGRVHSMAYAMQIVALEVTREGGRPFFGYGSQGILPPEEIRVPTNSEGIQKAKAHIEQAIQQYRLALNLNTNNLAAQFGLAWCLDQTDDKSGARIAYRIALEQAWAREKEQKSFHALQASFTKEVADCLEKLLDPVRDKDELAKLNEIRALVSRKGRAVTPIIIPVEADSNLQDLVNSTAAVTFDLDGSGLPRQWGWITPKAAWLVYDREGTGRITSGLQLIGGVTFWVFWSNGYEALAALDDNGDGELHGAELTGLALWHDANSNGLSEPGEVKPLSHWNITALSCRYETHATRIPFSPLGVTFNDGSTRPSYDWIARSPTPKPTLTSPPGK